MTGIELKEAIEELEFVKDRFYSFPKETGISNDIKNIQNAIKAINELEDYYAIGTAEEFREGRERQIPKKPMRIRLLETSGVHFGICPICKNPVYADLSNKNHREYCGHCGQAIDWSENNGE